MASECVRATANRFARYSPKFLMTNRTNPDRDEDEYRSTPGATTPGATTPGATTPAAKKANATKAAKLPSMGRRPLRVAVGRVFRG